MAAWGAWAEVGGVKCVYSASRRRSQVASAVYSGRFLFLRLFSNHELNPVTPAVHLIISGFINPIGR
jgi:hypothetical protein